MPSGKRAGAGRPRSTSPRLTPAYVEVRDARLALLSMVPTWTKSLALGRGAVKHDMIDLQAAYAEWLEVQQPGQGEIFRQIVNPMRWTDAFKEALPRVQYKSDTRSNRCWLNVQVEVKKPMMGKRYGLCTLCRQPCLIDVQTRQPSVSTEALTEGLAKLQQEAVAAVGPEAAACPSTSQRPSIDKT